MAKTWRKDPFIIVLEWGEEAHAPAEIVRIRDYRIAHQVFDLFADEMRWKTTMYGQPLRGSWSLSLYDPHAGYEFRHLRQYTRGMTETDDNMYTWGVETDALRRRSLDMEDLLDE